MTPAYKRCSCGVVYTAAGFAALPFVGNMLSEDETGAYCAQLRNCPCGSTIAVETRVADELTGATRLERELEAGVLLEKKRQAIGVPAGFASLAPDEAQALLNWAEEKP